MGRSLCNDAISDEIVELEADVKHVAVYCHGCWYKLNIFIDDGRGRRATAAELERCFSLVDTP